MQIQKCDLEYLYLDKKKSAAEIAVVYNCSESKVHYWLKKYNVPKRSISDAIYSKRNPQGDPFHFNSPDTLYAAMLYGLGIGLYWGEGTKSNKHAVRLGNSDPKLIFAFMRFLGDLYGVDKNLLRFGLQIFSDTPKEEALAFWKRELGVSETQFYKVIVTPSRGVGTYRNKAKFGVLTVYFNNKKLRDMICGAVENIDLVLLRENIAEIAQ